MVAACAGVLFVYFLELQDPFNASSPRDELARFALSRDGLHFTPLNGGEPIPALIPVNGPQPQP